TDTGRTFQPPLDASAAIPPNCEPAYRVPAARTPWRTRAMPFQISLSTSVFGTSPSSHPPTPAGLVVAPAALVPPAVPRPSHPTAHPLARVRGRHRADIALRHPEGEVCRPLPQHLLAVRLRDQEDVLVGLQDRRVRPVGEERGCAIGDVPRRVPELREEHHRP